LPEASVRNLVAEAHVHSAQFGLLVEVAAVTGARVSQLISVGKRTGRKPGLPMPAAAGDSKFSHLHPMNLCKLAHEVRSSPVHFFWLGQISNDFRLPGQGHLPVTRKGSQHVIVP
jgi:hypothetical protein